MGFFPNWLKELDIMDFFRSVGKDVQKIPKIAGGIVSGTVRPILGGVRSALTPTLIWLLVFVIIGLIVFKNYKKILNI